MPLPTGSGLFSGDVAQLVEQRTENPCVGGSIPSITTSPSTLKGFFLSEFGERFPRQLFVYPHIAGSAVIGPIGRKQYIAVPFVIVERPHL